tara:strand:- start:5391 stop:6149 length:759 start_codon:yes stop_codon:yes gene_type:complete
MYSYCSSVVSAASNFNRYKVSPKPQIGLRPIKNTSSRAKTLLEVISDLEGSTNERYDRSKTIFYPGDSSKKLYLIKKGAVRLSRIYETGEEITVAFLKENSLFGISSILAEKDLGNFYHAIAFTRVEMTTAPASAVRDAIEADTSVGMLLLQGLSSRIFQSATMIETLKNKDTYSRLISFLLVLSKDFGIPSKNGITIDLKISQEEIAEAICSTRVTITRMFGELKNSGLIAKNKNNKITVIDPTALEKRLN